MDFNMRFQGIEAKQVEAPRERGIAGKYETAWVLPGQSGEGFIRRFEIVPGFVLFLSDYRVVNPLTIEIDYPHPGLGFGFCLSGSVCGRATGMRNDVHTVGGLSNIIYYRDQTGVTTDAPDTHRQSVTILLEPEVLHSMFLEDMGRTAAAFRRLADGTVETAFSQSAGLTPEMHVALNQLYNVPLHGAARKVYLESKALELIALRMHCLLDGRADAADRYRFSAADMGRVHDAAETLSSNMLAPPTLAELSKAVGLSHVKLNRGFRKAFGTTVFGYLRQVRLQRAKRYLETRRMNVTEASFAVGYNSLSSFTKAFQGQYGITPHSCIKNA